MLLLRHSVPSLQKIAPEPDPRPGFKSFKTTGAIRYPSRWHRDLLIQTTLDSNIEAIEPAPGERQDACSFGIFVLVDGIRQLLIAVRDDLGIDPVDISVGGLPIPRSYILAEPRCSTARAIWSSRGALISPADRVRILGILWEDEEGISLGKLTERASESIADPVSVAFFLVCAGQAEVDISISSISPETIIRRRRRDAPKPEKSTADIIAGTCLLNNGSHQIPT